MTTDIAIQRAVQSIVPLLMEASQLTPEEAALASAALVQQIVNAGIEIREKIETPSIDTPLDTAQEHIVQFFSYAHLPALLQDISRPFAEQATRILSLPRNPERTVALRKLLESKDAAVRAYIARDPQ